MADAPRRRLNLALELGADDPSELVHALRILANELEFDEREERLTTSGGYASGYHLTLTCDEDQTGDRYRQQLERWNVDRRQAVLERKFREATP